MTEVTIHEAKIHLSQLIQLALQGEEIVIAKVVKLVALPEARRSRTLGLHPEAVIYIADDFDDPLPEFAESVLSSQ